MKCLLVIGLLLAASGAMPEQTARPTSEWKLNVAKSTFEPGPPPRSITTTLFPSGRYIKIVSTIVDAHGQVSMVEYRVASDGEEVPVKGTRAYDSVSMKSIDANTTEATRRKNGKIVQVSTRVRSADGNTATFTIVGTDERGRKIHDVTVFERQ
jgi:hypothetical protein